jgi:hypothetical protein
LQPVENVKVEAQDPDMWTISTHALLLREIYLQKEAEITEIIMMITEEVPDTVIIHLLRSQYLFLLTFYTCSRLLLHLLIGIHSLLYNP